MRRRALTCVVCALACAGLARGAASARSRRTSEADGDGKPSPAHGRVMESLAYLSRSMEQLAEEAGLGDNDGQLLGYLERLVARKYPHLRKPLRTARYPYLPILADLDADDMERVLLEVRAVRHAGPWPAGGRQHAGSASPSPPDAAHRPRGHAAGPGE